MRFLCDGHVIESPFPEIPDVGATSQHVDTKQVAANSNSEFHVTATCTGSNFDLNTNCTSRRIQTNGGGR